MKWKLAGGRSYTRNKNGQQAKGQECKRGYTTDREVKKYVGRSKCRQEKET